MRQIRERGNGRGRAAIRFGAFLLLVLGCVCMAGELLGKWKTHVRQERGERANGQAVEVTADGNFIKWVEFHVTNEAMAAAYDLDVDSYRDEIHLNWIELLAYVGAKTGGQFDKNSVRKIEEVAEKLKSGEHTMAELTKDMEYYDYYLEAYTAVLGGMMGEFTLDGRHVYGLKAFSPIAKGFDYSHYDDFGSSRSYGYARPHLGHDMMGQIGTPIRIKYRACALKNDAQAFIIQYALLDNFTNQFVFRMILDRVEVIKEIADVIIDFRFHVPQGSYIVFPERSLPEISFKSALALIQFLDLGNDV